MSASLILPTLIPAFRSKVQDLIESCLAANVVIVPYFGRRSLGDQAKLWRRSRTGAEVDQAVAMLNRANAPYLASVLAGVGPQPTGPWATNALPGQSWHQWGEAVDCYVERDGKPAWAATDPGYEIYAQHALALGLTAGARWSRPDTDHVQLRPAAAPTDTLAWDSINRSMQTLGEVQSFG